MGILSINFQLLYYGQLIQSLNFLSPFAGAQYLQMFGLQALVIDSLQIQSTEQDLHSWKPQNECACTGSWRGVGSHCLLLKLALTTIWVQHSLSFSNRMEGSVLKTGKL